MSWSNAKSWRARAEKILDAAHEGLLEGLGSERSVLREEQINELLAEVASVLRAEAHTMGKRRGLSRALDIRKEKELEDAKWMTKAQALDRMKIDETQFDWLLANAPYFWGPSRGSERLFQFPDLMTDEALSKFPWPNHLKPRGPGFCVEHGRCDCNCSFGRRNSLCGD